MTINLIPHPVADNCPWVGENKPNGNTVCSYVYDDLGQLLRENNVTLNRT